ncbi:hypothetical protein RCIP0057_00017 [Klebsiella phage RCIP0057]
MAAEVKKTCLSRFKAKVAVAGFLQGEAGQAQQLPVS